jgi:hypothetical protein
VLEYVVDHASGRFRNDEAMFQTAQCAVCTGLPTAGFAEPCGVEDTLGWFRQLGNYTD